MGTLDPMLYISEKEETRVYGRYPLYYSITSINIAAIALTLNILYLMASLKSGGIEFSYTERLHYMEIIGTYIDLLIVISIFILESASRRISVARYLDSPSPFWLYIESLKKGSLQKMANMNYVTIRRHIIASIIILLLFYVSVLYTVTLERFYWSLVLLFVTVLALTAPIFLLVAYSYSSPSSVIVYFEREKNIYREISHIKNLGLELFFLSLLILIYLSELHMSKDELHIYTIPALILFSTPFMYKLKIKNYPLVSLASAFTISLYSIIKTVQISINIASSIAVIWIALAILTYMTINPAIKANKKKTLLEYIKTYTQYITNKYFETVDTEKEEIPTNEIANSIILYSYLSQPPVNREIGKKISSYLGIISRKLRDIIFLEEFLSTTLILSVISLSNHILDSIYAKGKPSFNMALARALAYSTSAVIYIAVNEELIEPKGLTDGLYKTLYKSMMTLVYFRDHYPFSKVLKECMDDLNHYQNAAMQATNIAKIGESTYCRILLKR